MTDIRNVNAENAQAMDWYNGLSFLEKASVDVYINRLHNHFQNKRYRPMLGDAYKLELVFKVYPFINKRDK